MSPSPHQDRSPPTPVRPSGCFFPGLPALKIHPRINFSWGFGQKASTFWPLPTRSGPPLPRCAARGHPQPRHASARGATKGTMTGRHLQGVAGGEHKLPFRPLSLRPTKKQRPGVRRGPAGCRGSAGGGSGKRRSARPDRTARGWDGGGGGGAGGARVCLGALTWRWCSRCRGSRNPSWR